MFLGCVEGPFVVDVMVPSIALTPREHSGKSVTAHLADEESELPAVETDMEVTAEGTTEHEDLAVIENFFGFLFEEVLPLALPELLHGLHGCQAAGVRKLGMKSAASHHRLLKGVAFCFYLYFAGP